MSGMMKPRPQKIPKKKGIPFVPFMLFLLIIVLVVVFFWQRKTSNQTRALPEIVQNTQIDTTLTAKVDSLIPGAGTDSVAQTKPPVTIPGNQTKTTVVPPQQSASNYTERYERAISLFHSENYTESMKELNSLIAEYPSHSYSVNCKYWIGECYFGQGNFSAALETFQNVMSQGTSDKNDDAVMMIGRCYYKMNDNTNAKFYFNRLINEFPYSEYISKARSHLAKL